MIPTTHIDWDTVYKENENLVRQVCYSYEKDTELLEDLVQEVWERAFERGYQFSGLADIGTWLWQIASRCGQNHIRSSESEPDIVYFSNMEKRAPSSMGSEDDGTDDQEAFTDALVDYGGTPEEWARADETADLIDANRDISKMAWVVLHLHAIQSLTTEQIAEATGVSESTVRTYLQRVREDIQRILEK